MTAGTSEQKMRNPKTTTISTQAVDVRDKLCIRNKPQILPSLQKLLECNSVELCVNPNEHLIEKDMDKTNDATSGARNY